MDSIPLLNKNFFDNLSKRRELRNKISLTKYQINDSNKNFVPLRKQYEHTLLSERYKVKSKLLKNKAFKNEYAAAFDKVMGTPERDLTEAHNIINNYFKKDKTYYD